MTLISKMPSRQVGRGTQSRMRCCGNSEKKKRKWPRARPLPSTSSITGIVNLVLTLGPYQAYRRPVTPTPRNPPEGQTSLREAAKADGHPGGTVPDVRLVHLPYGRASLGERAHRH